MGYTPHDSSSSTVCGGFAECGHVKSLAFCPDNPTIKPCMVDLALVCLAEYGAIKGMAVLVLLVIVYLYWDDFKEKRMRRREKRELEERRRQAEARKK